MFQQEDLRGDTITLRRLTEDDVPLLARWMFTPDVNRWLQLSEDPPEFRTEEAVRERFERLDADPWVMVWRIDDENGTPIGQIEMTDIRPLHGRAEVHLFIGEQVTWGRGYGTQAISAVCDFAFETLGLRRISTYADADNERVLRAFEKSGFQREGLLRQHRLRHGVPTDMVMVGRLRAST